MRRAPANQLLFQIPVVPESRMEESERDLVDSILEHARIVDRIVEQALQRSSQIDTDKT